MTKNFLHIGLLLLFAATPVIAKKPPGRGVVSVAKDAELPEEFKDATITEKLGAVVDVQNLRFRDEEGNEVSLSKYFQPHKPVLLMLVYYQCPNLCNFLLNGFTQSARTLRWTPGQEFEVVIVSINPKEDPGLAAEKKGNYIREYGRLGSEVGWHFLTGDESQIQALADQVGFGFYKDEKTGEYAHSSAIFVLTPEAKLSRILYGIEFPNKDLRLALLEASDGKIGTIVDRVLMFCYLYDPQAKSYAVSALRVMQVGGALTVLFIAGFIFFLIRAGRGSRPKDPDAKTGNGNIKGAA